MRADGALLPAPGDAGCTRQLHAAMVCCVCERWPHVCTPGPSVLPDTACTLRHWTCVSSVPSCHACCARLEATVLRACRYDPFRGFLRTLDTYIIGAPVPAADACSASGHLGALYARSLQYVVALFLSYAHKIDVRVLLTECGIACNTRSSARRDSQGGMQTRLRTKGMPRSSSSTGAVCAYKAVQPNRWLQLHTLGMLTGIVPACHTPLCSSSHAGSQLTQHPEPEAACGRRCVVQSRRSVHGRTSSPNPRAARCLTQLSAMLHHVASRQRFTRAGS